MSGSPIRPHYVSLAQASVITGLSARTLRRAIAAKRLRAHHVGRLVRIEMDDLHQLIRGERGAAAPSARPTMTATAAGEQGEPVSGQ